MVKAVAVDVKTDERFAWLALSNLCFSINIAHQFVQLYVDSQNAYPREYSHVVAIAHVIALGSWCVPVAFVSYVLVQHPAERLSAFICNAIFGK